MGRERDGGRARARASLATGEEGGRGGPTRQAGREGACGDGGNGSSERVFMCECLCATKERERPWALGDRRRPPTPTPIDARVSARLSGQRPSLPVSDDRAATTLAQTRAQPSSPHQYSIQAQARHPLLAFRELVLPLSSRTRPSSLPHAITGARRVARAHRSCASSSFLLACRLRACVARGRQQRLAPENKGERQRLSLSPRRGRGNVSGGLEVETRAALA